MTILQNWLFWALLAAVFAGATAVLAKIGVADVSPSLATAIRTTVVLLFTWILALPAVSASALASLSRHTWGFLILSGLATGISWICYFRALQLGNVSQVAPVDKLSVVFAILFATLFLGEAVTWRHWLGGALVVAGAIVLTAK